MKCVKINGVSRLVKKRLSAKPMPRGRPCWQFLRQTNHPNKQKIFILNRGWQAAKALVFPVHCASCRQPCHGSADRLLICATCKISLLRHRTSSCPHCGLFSQAASRGEKSSLLPANCPGCSQRKLWFDATLALGPYRDELREAVLRSKRSTEEALTLSLGALMGRRLGPLLEAQEIDLIANTPTHWKRRWQRGVQSTELLLTGIVSQVKLPVASRLLCSKRFTKKQGTLSSAERFRNVSNAFRVRNRRQVQGKHVLVVDDVMTSGATLNELARILHQAGASKVSNVVLARGQCSS